MTPTPAQVSKKLEASLKKAGPKELARIMNALYRPVLDQAFVGKALKEQARIETQLAYIRDTFLPRLSVQEYNEFRREHDRLSDLDEVYRMQCAELRRLDDLIAYTGIGIDAAVIGTQGLQVASYELGEYGQEDDDDSPLKPWLGMLGDLNRGLRRNYAALIERRARLALSTVWEQVGRPCPVDPVFGSEHTALEASVGKPIPGSKELPLDREEVQAEERKAMAAFEARKKPRRRTAKK